MERLVLGETSAYTFAAAGAMEWDSVGSLAHAPIVQSWHQD